MHYIYVARCRWPISNNKSFEKNVYLRMNNDAHG